MQDYNVFINRIDAIKEQLDEQRELILMSLSDPMLLFDRASQIFSSRKDTIFKIMSVYEDNQRKMDSHQFQEFLCSIVDSYFQQTFKDDKLEVKVRNPNSFPSIFAVYYDDMEIIQFDIIERFYGKRTILTKEDIEKRYIGLYEDYQEELDRLNDKLYKMISAKNDPLGYVIEFHKNKKKKVLNKLFYGAKELLVCGFQKDKLVSLIDKSIADYEKMIEEVDDRYSKYNNRTEDIDNLEIQEYAMKFIESMFIEHNYRFEIESHKLY